MKIWPLLILLSFSCQRQTENVVESDDYVLVEFAARLEEEQEKFSALQGKPIGPE